MTAEYVTDEITFPSAPISGDTLATVQLVGGGREADLDWQTFEFHCVEVASRNEGEVNPNLVRESMTDEWGDLCIDPQRYASFWGLATRPKPRRPRKGRPVRTPFLVNVGWTINGDKGARNAGKPLRLRRLRPISEATQ